MPGCTAPNCTNSTQKGFKLYHFPSDKERSSVWVRNCGRERGWQPTKHTCVCEVHFDEAQFESHRADGLRKLKPNAIPTIFNTVTSVRTYSKKSKSINNEKISKHEDEFNKQKNNYMDIKITLTSEDEEKEELRTNINIDEDSENKKSEVLTGRKRGRPPKKLIQVNSNELPKDESNIVTKRKRGRPASNNKNQKNSSPNKKSVRRTEGLPISKPTEEDATFCEDKHMKIDIAEENECFVCGRFVDTGISLHTLTNTTKMYIYQKLEKIVTGEIELLIEEKSVLCTRCTNLINYVDRIEVELSMLNKTILNYIRKRYELGVKVTHTENLLPGFNKINQKSNDELLIAQNDDKESSNHQWISYEANFDRNIDKNCNINSNFDGKKKHIFIKCVVR